MWSKTNSIKAHALTKLASQGSKAATINQEHLLEDNLNSLTTLKYKNREFLHGDLTSAIN